MKFKIFSMMLMLFAFALTPNAQAMSVEDGAFMTYDVDQTDNLFCTAEMTQSVSDNMLVLHPSDFIVHMEVNTSESPFICKKSDDDLNSQLITHYDDDGVKQGLYKETPDKYGTIRHILSNQSDEGPNILLSKTYSDEIDAYVYLYSNRTYCLANRIK